MGRAVLQYSHCTCDTAWHCAYDTEQALGVGAHGVQAAGGRWADSALQAAGARRAAGSGPAERAGERAWERGRVRGRRLGAQSARWERHGMGAQAADAGTRQGVADPRAEERARGRASGRQASGRAGRAR